MTIKLRTVNLENYIHIYHNFQGTYLLFISNLSVIKIQFSNYLTITVTPVDYKNSSVSQICSNIIQVLL